MYGKRISLYIISMYMSDKNFNIYHIEMPFNSFANRADPDQTALVRAAWSGSTLFAYGNIIRYDPDE